MTLKKIMAPFYGWGLTAVRLQGDSLLFATKPPVSPGTHLIYPERMEG